MIHVSSTASPARSSAFAFPAKSAILFGMAGLAGLAAGTAFDLSVSNALYQPHSGFGQFMAVFASAPLFWNLNTAALLMLDRSWLSKFPVLSKKTASLESKASPASSTIKDHSANNWLNGLSVLLLLSAVVYNLYGGTRWLLAAGHHPVFSCGIALILTFLVIELPSLWFYRALGLSNRKERLRIACFLLVFSIGQILLVNLLKLIWSRPRYYFLISDDRADFQPWYQWNADLKNSILTASNVDPDFFKSFPSAHTSSASCIFSLLLLKSRLKEKRLYPAILLVIICWIGLAALSRIILGAHFLSDVSAGMLCSLLWFWISWKLCLKNKPKVSD